MENLSPSVPVQIEINRVDHEIVAVRQALNEAARLYPPNLTQVEGLARQLRYLDTQREVLASVLVSLRPSDSAYRELLCEREEAQDSLEEARDALEEVQRSALQLEADLNELADAAERLDDPEEPAAVDIMDKLTNAQQSLSELHSYI